MGRIPRYILLLQELLKLTTQEHPDRRDLDSAITALRLAGKTLNEKVNDDHPDNSPGPPMGDGDQKSHGCVIS